MTRWFDSGFASPARSPSHIIQGFPPCCTPRVTAPRSLLERWPRRRRTPTNESGEVTRWQRGRRVSHSLLTAGRKSRKLFTGFFFVVVLQTFTVQHSMHRCRDSSCKRAAVSGSRPDSGPKLELEQRSRKAQQTSSVEEKKKQR